MSTHHLPLVRPHEREHTFCAFCPKLCRFACPVSTVQGRETTTPWAKMASVHHVALDQLDLQREHAATWYACSGCMRCRSFCEHDNEVAATLNAARAEAMRAGVAPDAARDVLERHKEREARASAAAERIFQGAMKGRAPVVYVPGCTACVTSSEDARAGLSVVQSLSGSEVRVEAGACCGLPLLEAGDQAGFLAAAKRFLDRLSGAERVVFGDPGCLHALARVAPSLGLSHDFGMEHLSQLAARALTRLGPVRLEGEVRYQDPCRLGRGMGVYEEPRAVLSRLLGRPAGEFSQNRERAECCGAGGQLPRTDRPTAEAVAAERLDAHQLAGGGTVVTACTSCQRALSRAGARTRDLGSLIAEAVGDG